MPEEKEAIPSIFGYLHGRHAAEVCFVGGTDGETGAAGGVRGREGGRGVVVVVVVVGGGGGGGVGWGEELS